MLADLISVNPSAHLSHKVTQAWNSYLDLIPVGFEGYLARLCLAVWPTAFTVLPLHLLSHEQNTSVKGPVEPAAHLTWNQISAGRFVPRLLFPSGSYRSTSVGKPFQKRTALVLNSALVQHIHI